MKFLAYFIAIATISSALSSCGRTIKPAQDFRPNKAPQISDITATNSDGSAINTGKIEPNRRYRITVTASDPDGSALSYSFNSNCGSFQNITANDSGCSATFITGNVTGGMSVKVSVSATDPIGAMADGSIDIGTGKLGPTISVSMDRSHIKSTGNVVLTVSANCFGTFQIDMGGSATAPAFNDSDDMLLFEGTPSTFTLTGPLSSETGPYQIPSRSDYSNQTYRVWILFKDGLNQSDAYEFTIYVNDLPPNVSIDSPAGDSSNVAVSPTTVSVTFDNEIDATTLPGALHLSNGFGASNGTVSLTSENTTAGETRATYTVTGLAKNTIYTVNVSGAMDLAGNSNIPLSQNFTTIMSIASGTYTNVYGDTVPTVSYDLPTNPKITFTEHDALVPAGGVSFPVGGAYVPSDPPYTSGKETVKTGTLTEGFTIAETAVTYELWMEVYTWGTTHGYTFANNPPNIYKGSYSATDVSPASANQPVNGVSCRDMIVWCNAYTEYMNAHAGTAFTIAYNYMGTPLRDSTTSASDNVVINPSANGFRLMSLNEYTYAAEYNGKSNNGRTDLITGGAYTPGYYWTPGSYASGALAEISNVTETNKVAVVPASLESGVSSNPVGSKLPNALGLYDMNGNGYQWVFDTGTGGIGTRYYLGGDYHYIARDSEIGATNGGWATTRCGHLSPNAQTGVFTLRVVRNR